VALEQVVVYLCARDDDALGIDAMELDRLALELGVPDRDRIRLRAKPPFTGQVVPAGDASDHRNAGRASGPDQIVLVGNTVDQRRHEHDIGPLFGEKACDPAVQRHNSRTTRTVEIERSFQTRLSGPGTACVYIRVCSSGVSANRPSR
jgi:hypothetical protein